jgi:hypothetical protein
MAMNPPRLQIPVHAAAVPSVSSATQGGLGARMAIGAIWTGVVRPIAIAAVVLSAWRGKPAATAEEQAVALTMAGARSETDRVADRAGGASCAGGD